MSPTPPTPGPATTPIDGFEPIGGLTELSGETAPIPWATLYVAERTGEGMRAMLAAGALEGAACLTADMLLEGTEVAVFELKLYADEAGQTEPFIYMFSLLPGCEARMVLPLSALDQNQWLLPRRGAMLKPMCNGARLDPLQVRRITLTLARQGHHPVRWCQTPLSTATDEPPELTEPRLPAGPLVDELGQSAQRRWPGRVSSIEAMARHLYAQRLEADEAGWPEDFSPWGGWLRQRYKPTGYFRTQYDDRGPNPRWWLVDPEGYAFWSTGPDCVRPGADGPVDGMESAFAWLPPRHGDFAEAWGKDRLGRNSVNFEKVNLIRAFGVGDWEQEWAAMTLGMLRSLGFNTVANWSAWEIAHEAQFPYVLPLRYGGGETPNVFRDLPDVFDPRFERDAADFAGQLEPFRHDPALIGYFLMNEPQWGFARQSPAEGMLINSVACYCRIELARWLRQRYGGDSALAEAWGLAATAGEVAEGRWAHPLTDAARSDLAAFSTIMIERFFSTLSHACRRADPNHLNLGVRYYTVPPDWVLDAMGSFDVFSMNAYTEKVPAEGMQRIYDRLGQPMLIGEWHFGALDVGLPATGIGHVADQQQRGRAYRVYLEDAAAKPWCIGAHWFTLTDQACWGRFDGEAYNIGFFDVCLQPYKPLAEAARLSHERLYQVAIGEHAPYDSPVAYLPKLF